MLYIEKGWLSNHGIIINLMAKCVGWTESPRAIKYLANLSSDQKQKNLTNIFQKSILGHHTKMGTYTFYCKFEFCDIFLKDIKDMFFVSRSDEQFAKYLTVPGLSLLDIF